MKKALKLNKIFIITLIGFILSLVLLMRFYDVRFFKIRNGYKTSLKHQGSYGRLVIPDDSVSVAVNYGKPGLNQAICDKIDSALYVEDGASRIIADHSTQGFRRLKKSIPGKTVMYLSKGKNVERMICAKIFKGHNVINELTDENYRNIEDDNPDGIITYTCDGSWQNIIIVFWETAL